MIHREITIHQFTNYKLITLHNWLLAYCVCGKQNAAVGETCERSCCIFEAQRAQGSDTASSESMFLDFHAFQTNA